MASLLDSIFQPQTYSSSLFDRLMPSVGQLPQSAGFPQPQNNPINVGGYSMPRAGNPDMYEPQQAMTPQMAQPTQGMMPQRAPQQSQGLPASLNPATPGFMNFYQSLKHGGGLLGSIYAGATGQRLDPAGVQQQQLQAQYQAMRQSLLDNGVDPQKANSMAVLATLNPEAAKTILPEMLTTQWKPQVMKDALGGEHVSFINPRTQQVKGAEGSEGTGWMGTSPTFSALAPGVKQYDPNLTGEDYLKQFGPEVKAAVKSYLNGDVMPTGNARQQSINTFAKTVAQKYASDMGIPASDTTYQEKRKLKTDLASSSNSSMGGILSNGESSFAHLAEAAKSAADLGNASHNFPGGGLLAHAQNYVGNKMGGSSQLGKVNALNQNLTRYGQESTKFYAGTGGGVGEREQARRDVNAATTSSAEYADYLEKEMNLMTDRLNGKFQQLEQVLGPEEAQKEIAKHMPAYEKNVSEIKASIAKLRGEASETPKASTKDKPKTVIQNGHTYTLQADGSYK